MEKKNYKLINKKLHRKQFKVLITLFLSFCFCIQFSFSTDYITVWPYEIKFDYETGHTNDAITIRKADGTPAAVPEWNNTRSNNFAYIKGQSNRKIQVRFNSYCESMHLLINLNVISGNGFGEICNFFVVNYNKLDWITLTLDGSVPNSVGVREFTWEWEIYAIPNDPAYCSAMSYNETDHSYYTLLAAPQAPMTEPWSSVLDYACDWANGQTTATNAATKIAESLYTCGFDYETARGAPKYYVEYMQFDLEQIISDLENPTGIKVNCLDMAMSVVTFGNASGSDLNLSTFNGYWVVDRYWFPLNYIDPIGSASPTNNTFSSPPIGNDCRTGGFAYHAFAENDNHNVWDATLRYDIDSDPDNVNGSNPGCGSTTTGFDWGSPCNKTESTYIEHLVDPWTNKTDCDDRQDCGSFSHGIGFTIYNDD